MITVENITNGTVNTYSNFGCNHINIEQNKKEGWGICKYLVSGELCLCGKEKILMKDIGNNCTRCLSYEPEPEEEEEEDFDADEADYEDL
jgi:hypothetical protein